MRPVAIFRHAATEGPGYLATFLDARQIPWQLFCIDAGDVVPDDCRQFSGLVFMGGPMSVNDDLPWIPAVMALIRCAVQADIPVLGHCLGGQLMSKALGGTVSRTPIKEIGWGRVQIAQNPQAQMLFGNIAEFDALHWHGETFSLPEGATWVLSSPYCENQAFVLGKHIGFQCHIEMTADMVSVWCENGVEEIRDAASSPAVQQPAAMLQHVEQHIAALNKVAEQVYTRWVKGLVS